MNLFPKQNYSIELMNESSVAILKLKNQTLPKEKYISDWNNQAFIGIVGENDFEVKISNKLYGEFCVLKGKFDDFNGIINIQITKTLKILTILLIASAFLSIIMSIINNRPLEILYSVLGILTMKFIFLDLGLTYFSKIGIKKMSEIIDIKEIKKE